MKPLNELLKSNSTNHRHYTVLANAENPLHIHYIHRRA
ncbi:Uncharacterised protein [Vibrio cholerae]|nr:Uncharacterised protein [Vibrio cholerae]